MLGLYRYVLYLADFRGERRFAGDLDYLLDVFLVVVVDLTVLTNADLHAVLRREADDPGVNFAGVAGDRSLVSTGVVLALYNDAYEDLVPVGERRVNDLTRVYYHFVDTFLVEGT